MRSAALKLPRRGLKLVRQVTADPLHFFERLSVECQSHAWLSMMGKPVLFLNDATAIGHVLMNKKEKYQKGEFYQVLKPTLGQGIFLSEGSLWKRQRRSAMPAFAASKLPQYTPEIINATQSMLKRWDNAANRGVPIDLVDEMMWLTLDIALRTLFHSSNEASASMMKEALGALLKEAESRIWAAVSLPQKLVLQAPKYRSALGFLKTLTSQLLAKHEAAEQYPDDLLTILRGSHPLSAADEVMLRDQIVSFLLAGHETTANGLSWLMYELARHTEIKDRVVSEITSCLEGAAPDDDNLKDLRYSRMAFYEALRLYPPVWTMSRRTLEDDVIALDHGQSVSVPAGTNVMLCTYTVHRRRDYWPDPESFTPERFTENNSRTRPQFAWFPFSGGPRFCLGFKFAENESLSVLAMILQKFELELVLGQRIAPDPIITLRPDQPIMFNIRRRTASETLAPHLVPEDERALIAA